METISLLDTAQTERAITKRYVMTTTRHIIAKKSAKAIWWFTQFCWYAYAQMDRFAHIAHCLSSFQWTIRRWSYQLFFIVVTLISILDITFTIIYQDNIDFLWSLFLLHFQTRTSVFSIFIISLSLLWINLIHSRCLPFQA